MVNVLDYSSLYYIQFWTNTLEDNELPYIYNSGLLFFKGVFGIK